MTTSKDEQARQRLVEIALKEAKMWPDLSAFEQEFERREVRQMAGFKNPAIGHWCAAGITAAMAQAGLRVPAPGTPARRGAIALLDWVATLPGAVADRADVIGPVTPMTIALAQPGDIIAWKQNPDPASWMFNARDWLRHAFAEAKSMQSMCGKMDRASGVYLGGRKRCSSCAWGTRKGHVAVIVATDSEYITTVGWNEGPSPGRVMMRRLWRDTSKIEWRHGEGEWSRAKFAREVPRSSTVLWRRDGGLAGIARPVAA